MLNFLLDKDIALQEIGLYSFYNKIAGSFLMFLVIFRMIWSPLVIKYYRNKNYKIIFQYLILFAGTVSLFVALFVGLFSYEILNLLSGSDKYLIKHNALALIFVTQLLILLGDYMPVGIDIKRRLFIEDFLGYFLQLQI